MILVYGLSIYAPLANGISAQIAIMFNFLLNNFWSFRHKKLEGSYFKKYLLFNIVSIGNVFIQAFGMEIAFRLFGSGTINILSVSIPAWIVYKVFIIALFVIPYSYFMYNRFIWKGPKNAGKL